MWCRLGFLLLFLPSFAWAQCPAVDFALPAASCKQSVIAPTATATGATTLSWDFCDGSILNTPTKEVDNFVTGIVDPYDLKYIEEAGNSYAFLVDLGASKFLRFDFGQNLTATPTLVDLGSLGILHPIGIGFWIESNLTYAIVVTEGPVYRLTFGSSVTNTPTVTQIAGLTLTDHRQMKIVRENGQVLAIIAGGNTRGVSILNFGSSILNLPTSTFTAIPNAAYLEGLDLLIDCANKYALIGGEGSGLHVLAFGSSFLNTPSITQLAGFIGAHMLGMTIVRSKGNVYALVAQSPSGIVRIDFGPQITNPNPVQTDVWVNMGINYANGHTIAQRGSKFYSISMNYGGRFTVLDFPKDCSILNNFQNTLNPVTTISESGTFAVTLSGVDAEGQTSTVTRNLVVNSNLAPSFSINENGACLINAVTFNGQSADSQPLSNVVWDFGDGNAGSGQGAQHQYGSIGSYPVVLNAIASNGCGNRVTKNIEIYNKPLAGFSLPSGQVCTNNEFTFATAQVDNYNGQLTYQWQVNGINAGTNRDLKFTFLSAIDQQISQTISIPGCSDMQSQMLTSLLVGPTVGFNTSGQCEDVAINFTNTSAGDILGYFWNFGNGQTSTNDNESQLYPLPGVYTVSLQTTANNGCISISSRALNIYTTPQPDFSVGLPPFSCNNSPTPFQNNSPLLSDSNVSSWVWQFGDSQGGTSSQQSPSYVYASSGTFSATLTATSDAGCYASITKPINISSSPTADFTVGPACVNQSTKFTDLSTGGVQSRLWQIGSASFSSASPTYTFTNSGSFATSLTVTASNGCSNTKSNPTSVPVVPFLNFSTATPCAGKNSTFTDQTTSPTDGVVGWNWNFAGNSVTGNPATYNFKSTGTYNVKMTTTHSSGCIYTLSRNVVINPTPAVGFTASPDRGAAPLTVQFTNTSQQATAYTWRFYDKVTGTSTQISPVYTFTSLGDYSAELTATNAQGCSDIMTVPIKVLVPSIDLIMQDFSLASDPVTGKIRCLVTILNNSNVPITSSEVALFLADKAVVNETLLLNLRPGQSATHTLSFTLSSSQFDFNYLCAEVNTEKDVQVDNNKKCVNLEIGDYFFTPYPNPSTGILQVDWISQVAGSARVIVYDAMGRKMYDWQTMTHTGLNQTVLDLTFLSAGSYFVTIETSVSRKTTRFLRE